MKTVPGCAYFLLQGYQPGYHLASGPGRWSRLLSESRDLDGWKTIRPTLSRWMLRTLKDWVDDPKMTQELFGLMYAPFMTIPTQPFFDDEGGCNPLLTEIGQGVVVWPEDAEAGKLARVIQEALSRGESCQWRLKDAGLIADVLRF
jgi:hypothetical protein